MRYKGVEQRIIGLLRSARPINEKYLWQLGPSSQASQVAEKEEISVGTPTLNWRRIPEASEVYRIDRLIIIVLNVSLRKYDVFLALNIALEDINLSNNPPNLVLRHF